MSATPATPVDALAGRHVLLGVSGGIAAYKAAGLTRALLRDGATVQVVMTEAATRFVGAATFEGLTQRRAYTDVFGDAADITHVRLAREADVAVVAPATANALAKFALGLADDLLSSVYACLTVPVVLAPAMHTEMWLHPATQANVAVLRERGVRIVEPPTGQLAGGDIGPGRLADEADLLAAVAAALGPAASASPLHGRRVLVTAGGTREPIDPVRFIGNRSSGRMGYALAEEALRRGASVDLVSAPTHLTPPARARLHPVQTAEEMRASVMGLARSADVIIKAAAVADYRPAQHRQHKIRKDSDFSEIPLERTPDILAELGADRGGALLVGFAAETEHEEERGRAKLEDKGLDLIVVNRVDAADAGFDVDTNRALLLSADGRREEAGLASKADLARRICDRVDELLTAASEAARP